MQRPLHDDAYKGIRMMMLSEIAKAVGGQLIGDDVLCESVGTDSRHITKNQLFIALHCEHFDGNTFAETAIMQGAVAALVSDNNMQARPVVVVKDTRIALGHLAKYWREQFDLPLIAVTGSNGKTTVKEMLVSILKAANKNVLATQGNLNNDIGMPMTLLNLNAQHNAAVIEMGMNHLGEIDYLTRIAQPNVALINNAGTAHIGELGSRENIAKAKGEIFTGLKADGIAVINVDDKFADYWRSLNDGEKIVTFSLEVQADVTASYAEIDGVNRVQLVTPAGSICFDLAMLGKHNVSNALAASAGAYALGISNTDIAAGLSNMSPVKSRLQRKLGLNGATVIDDTYNANPDSMQAAIEVLATYENSIFVMGDMAELGADSVNMHVRIGGYAKQKGINQLLGFGENTAHAVKKFGLNGVHYASLQALLDALPRLLKPNVTVLVKGSRFMQMERVVKAIIKDGEQLIATKGAR